MSLCFKIASCGDVQTREVQYTSTQTVRDDGLMKLERKTRRIFHKTRGKSFKISDKSDVCIKLVCIK